MQQILVLVVRQRQQVVEETDQKDVDGDDAAEDNPGLRGIPSKEAASKFKEYSEPFANLEGWKELKLVQQFLTSATNTRMQQRRMQNLSLYFVCLTLRSKMKVSCF